MKNNIRVGVFAFIAGIFLIQNNSAISADIRLIDSKEYDVNRFPIGDPFGEIHQRYIIKLSGEINVDDSKKFESSITVVDKKIKGQGGNSMALAEDHSSYVSGRVVLMLDSNGGNFKESLKISRLVYKHKIPTLISGNSTCLSSCAIIFMHGIEQFAEAPPVRHRFVEVPGTLGFHRPFLENFSVNIPPSALKNISSKQIEDIFHEEYISAYDAANDMIYEMLSIDKGAWSNDLLFRMLLANIRNKNNKFVYLENVFDASEWNIGVFNLKSRFSGNLDRIASAYWMCHNSFSLYERISKSWSVSRDDDIASTSRVEEAFSSSANFRKEGAHYVNDIHVSPEKDSFDIIMEELDGSGCKVENNRSEKSISVTDSASGGNVNKYYITNPLSFLKMYGPGTKLKDISNNVFR